MKKIISTLVMSISLAAFATGCGQQGPAPQAAPAPATKIVVGLDDNFPPMGFRDDKNELTGFDIALARETARRLGREVEFKAIDWSAKEAELNGRRVDVLWNGLTITEERKKNIAFTAPYMENHQIIVVQTASPIKVKADLVQRVVGIQDGSSAVAAVEKDPISASFKELKKFGDNITALMDLGTGRLDAVVVDEVVGRYYVAKRTGEFRVLEENFGTEEFGVGVRKDDTELLGLLDKALADMKADGTAERISMEWFGSNVVK